MRAILKYILVVLVAIFIMTKITVAQTALDSLEIHQINGKEYYIHIVEKGESLYAIHKKYDIPVEVIKKENPSVIDGLSIGEKIFVPLKKVEIETSVDGNFINHIVQKKETLYAISKLYKVNQNQIIVANPSITEGLKEGESIKIPVKGIKKVTSKKEVTIKPDYKVHLVKSGETLYALSKLYHVSISSIQDVNEGLKEDLKVGDTIRIPISTIEKTVNTLEGEINIDSVTTSIISGIDTINKKDLYKIGLLLPFYLDENDEIVLHQSENILEKKTIYPKSKFAVEFYKGFLMALDAINSDSCKFQVYVYDTKGKDSIRIKKILKKEEFKNFDLIVGPLYYSNFQQVADFAKNHEIPIVSPVKQNNKILLGNSFVFKSIPSKSSTVDKVATLVVDSFKTDNLIAVVDEKAKEKSLVDLYIKAYNNKILQKPDTFIYSSIHKVNVATSYSLIVNKLVANKNNVVFVPSSNSTFITNLFNYLVNTLNKKEYEDYQITLIGIEEWLKYENIDLEYYQKLNVYLTVDQYVNYEDSITNDFIRSYILMNDAYPSKNSFLGYDIATYFANHFNHYGTVFYPNSENLFISNFSIQLSFFKTGIESGYENTNSHLLHFKDYTLSKVN